MRIFAIQRTGSDFLLAQVFAANAQIAARRHDVGTLYDGGNAFEVKQGDEHLARTKLAEGCFCVQVWVGAEGLRRSLERLALLRRVGTQCVLNFIAKLCQYVFRHIGRLLRDEVDADALGADKTDNLLYLGKQRRRCVLENQVRLVEEKDHLRLVEVACLRHHFVKLREHP